MPPRKQPRSVSEQVHEEIKTEITDLVSQIAAEEGPAPHAQYVSDDHEVDMWGQMDPQVDHETLVQQLMQGAVPPELVDPTADRPLALIKETPEMAQMFAEPLDQEMATLVATFAEYPYRMKLLAPYTDDPEASVKKSDSLTARWRRRLPAREPVVQPFAQSVAQPGSVVRLPAAPLGAPEPLGMMSSEGRYSRGRAPNPSPVAPPPLPPMAAPPSGSIGPSAPPLPREQLGGY